MTNTDAEILSITVQNSFSVWYSTERVYIAQLFICRCRNHYVDGSHSKYRVLFAELGF